MARTKERGRAAPTAAQLARSLRALGDPAIAEHSMRFFKTGAGQYGAGDRFLGVRVPAIRREARRFRELSQEQAERALASPWHEIRFCALVILVRRFEAGDAATRREVYASYLARTRYVNNWDLVDGSAPQIVGGHLLERSRRPLYRLAASSDLWERRIAIMATLAFIRRGDFGDTLALAGRLLGDEHDLIHKATGWMLREVGNRDLEVEEGFLRAHHAAMPRTMLRYAIEKLPAERRRAYLRGEI